MNASELTFWCLWGFFEVVGICCFLFALSLGARVRREQS